jgi:hypothetical protein
MKNFKELPNNPINGGIQYIAKYPNNYGASIVQHSFSYGKDKGLWELAVIKYEPNETNIRNFNLDYTTPITNDVLGHLTESEVNELLDKIEALT